MVASVPPVENSCARNLVHCHVNVLDILGFKGMKLGAHFIHHNAIKD